MARKVGIVDNSKYLVQNQTPYKIGQMDMHVFSAGQCGQFGKKYLQQLKQLEKTFRKKFRHIFQRVS